MTPDDAFAYVFADQYPDTTADTRRSLQAVAGTFDWQWAFASLFTAPPVQRPRFLTSAWRVGTADGTLSDGTKSRVLEVELAFTVEHLVLDNSVASAEEDAMGANGIGGLPGAPLERSPTEALEAASEAATGTNPAQLLRPIVMQRTIVIRGARPLGGAAWWPAVGVKAEPLFGGKCAPVNGALLTPAHRERTLIEDLERLRELVTDPGNTSGASATSAPNDLQDYVAKYCER